MPTSSQVRASLVEAPLLSASAKNRFGLRVDRLQPILAPVLRDFPRKLRVHYGFHSLRPQTIFTLPFPLFPRHLRLRLRRRVRSHCSVPRNLRLPFRLARTVICTPASNRHTAAIRHHPPTHRGLMNTRSLARGTRSFFAEGGNVGGFDCFPHPERGLRYGFRPLIPSVACIPVIADSEHFWPRFRFSPLRLKTAAAFGSRDYVLRLDSALSRHRSFVTVSGAASAPPAINSL